MNLMGKIIQGGTDEENERQLLGPGPNNFYNELNKRNKKNAQNNDNYNDDDVSSYSINNGVPTSLELSERPKHKQQTNTTATTRKTSGKSSNSSNSSRYGSFDQNDPTLRNNNNYQPPNITG